MSEAIVIEKLREEDIEKYERVLIESYSQYEQRFNNPTRWQNYLEAIRKTVENPQAEAIIVAKKGDEIVGGLQLYTNSEKAYGEPELIDDATIIRLLAVHPRGRRMGIAKKLLQASFDFARGRQDKACYLHTNDIMAEAIKLYEASGFVRDTSKEFYKGENLVKSFRYDLVS